MEAEKARDEKSKEKRRKEAWWRVSVETGAGKLTSKAESNAYAVEFQYVIVLVTGTVSELTRRHCPLLSNIYEMYVNLSNQECTKFFATGTPLIYAWVTEASLTLCTLKTEASMPALDRTELIHLPIVVVATGLWGYQINNFVLDRSFLLRKINSANVDVVHKDGFFGKT